MQHPPWPEQPPPAKASVSSSARVDVGIVGGGIHGAALARELTLRGISSAIVDVSGFGSGTSQWSTKLLHGGIRYLKTFDFQQIRQGLMERATWMQIAPHRCQWEAFWMPHSRFFTRLAHEAAITFYDSILGRNRPGWVKGELPLGSVDKTRFEADPRSIGSCYRGAIAYADLLTQDRGLTLDLLASSDALRYDFHTVDRWDIRLNGVVGAHLTDRRDGTKRELIAGKWVYALGPWNDATIQEWFGSVPGFDSCNRLRLSAGIHLWLEAVDGCEVPWTIQRRGGRVIFVIPRDGMLHVGTTEREVNEGYEGVVDSEREELYSALEEEMPNIPWRTLNVIKEDSGVRPLVLRPGNTQRLSRRARLEQLAPFANVTLVLGGKLTTARLLMNELATRITGIGCGADSETQKLCNSD